MHQAFWAPITDVHPPKPWPLAVILGQQYCLLDLGAFFVGRAGWCLSACLPVVLHTEPSSVCSAVFAQQCLHSSARPGVVIAVLLILHQSSQPNLPVNRTRGGGVHDVLCGSLWMIYDRH